MLDLGLELASEDFEPAYEDAHHFGRARFDGERHRGLPGMRERAELVGGRLEIAGRLGQGARIVLHLPLRRETVSKWNGRAS